MKHVFIVNPTSGQGKALKIVDRIEEVYLNNMEEEIHELLDEKNLENEDRII